MEKIRNNRKAALLFIAPGFLIYTVLLLLPIFGSAYLGLFQWNGIKGATMTFVGLNNFVEVLTDTAFWHSVKNIIWWMILTFLIQLPVGLLLAFMLSTHFRGYKFFKATYFVPQIISTTVIGLVWYFILMPSGVLNTTLKQMGLASLAHTWLVEKGTAMTTIILVNAWAGIGFHMTVSYSAIQAIPDDVMDAASLDGCVGLKKVFYIIIPLIWESIISCCIVIVTAVLKQFDLVYVMTSGGPNGLTDVPSTLLYKQAFKYSDYGVGSAIGVIIFIASVLCTLLTLRLTNKEKIEY